MKEDFGAAFDGADHLFVTDIYAASERPIDGIDGGRVAEALTSHGHPAATFEPDFDRIADDEIRRCVTLQHEAGLDIVTDGELRRDSFYSFVTDKLDGAVSWSLAELLDADGYVAFCAGRD